MSTARSQEGGREVSHYLRSLAKRMVRVTRYVAGYVRWLFVFERRVRAAVDQDRRRGARSVFARLPGLRQAGRQEPSRGTQAGAGGARAAGLAAAFLSG